jgi:hypothetical protein
VSRDLEAMDDEDLDDEGGIDVEWYPLPSWLLEVADSEPETESEPNSEPEPEAEAEPETDTK